MVIMPSVGVSRPAIILSVVVLPQPEGPRRVMNALSSIVIVRLSTPTKLPQRLVTFFNTISGILLTSYAFVYRCAREFVYNKVYKQYGDYY